MSLGDQPTSTMDKASQAADKAKIAPDSAPASTVCVACGGCGSRYQKHKKMTEAAKQKLTPQQQQSVQEFQNHWNQYHGEYEALGDMTDQDPKMLAAMRWRENDNPNTMDVYLQNGQTLGKTTTIAPKGIYYPKGQFKEAAAAGLKDPYFKKCQEALGLHRDNTDRAKVATFAETWNGAGYKGGSPYVYSGTDQYGGGLYTSDGVKSSKSDPRPGVLPLYDSISEPPATAYPDSTLIPTKDSPLYNPAQTG